MNTFNGFTLTRVLGCYDRLNRWQLVTNEPVEFEKYEVSKKGSMTWETTRDLEIRKIGKWETTRTNKRWEWNLNLERVFMDIETSLSQSRLDQAKGRNS